MFLIPAGMMLGAKVTFGDWWIWNQSPVTLGNLVGGLLFTALPWYLTYRPAVAAGKEPKAIALGQASEGRA